MIIFYGFKYRLLLTYESSFHPSMEHYSSKFTMRNTIICIVFTLCAISPSNVLGLDHYIGYKSFDTYFRECGEYFEVPNCTLDEYAVNAYPDEPEVRNLIHCTLVGSRSWHDGSGVIESVMANFFNPGPEDTCYADRTRECILSSQVPCDSNITLAYKAFQCYYRQYGNLNESSQYMPCTDRELQVLINTSIIMVNVPKDELVNYSNGVQLNQPHFAELLYVIFIRGGFYYTDDKTLALNNLYTQFGNPELQTPETQQCVNSATAAWDGKRQRDLVYAYFVNCLQKIVPWLQLIQQVATSLVTVPPPPCPPPRTTTTTTTTTTTLPPPSTLPPCYNIRS